MCDLVEGAGCDITDPLLEDFAGCFADEEFGCPDFESCAAAAAVIDSSNTTAVAATPAPAAVTATTAPTDLAALTTTMAPSSAEDVSEANEDSGVSRTAAIASAATRTAMTFFAFGLALFWSV